MNSLKGSIWQERATYGDNLVLEIMHALYTTLYLWRHVPNLQSTWSIFISYVLYNQLNHVNTWLNLNISGRRKMVLCLTWRFWTLCNSISHVIIIIVDINYQKQADWLWNHICRLFICWLSWIGCYGDMAVVSI